MKKAVGFEGGAVESSKTRGEDEGSCGRCAIAIVCTLVPPATAKWSTVAHTVQKMFGNKMWLEKGEMEERGENGTMS